MNLTPEEKHKAIIFFGLLKQLKADAKGRKVKHKNGTAAESVAESNNRRGVRQWQIISVTGTTSLVS